MIGQMVHFIPDLRGEPHAAIIIDDTDDPKVVDLWVFPRRGSDGMRKDAVSHESLVRPGDVPYWREPR